MTVVLRTLTADDVESVLSLWQVAFGRNDPASQVHRRGPFLRHPDRVRGAFVGDRLGAVARCYPFTMLWGDHGVRVGGIASVATAPEHRHAGLARSLMLDALNRLREEGVGWSALWPFSGAFYRRLGWERCHTDLLCEGSLVDLPRGGPFAPAELRPRGALYRAWAARWNGPLERSEEWWERRLGNFGTPSLAYEVPDRAFLHLQLEAAEPAVKVLDFLWRDAEAARALLGCLRGFAAQAQRWQWIAPRDAALLDPDQVQARVRPGLMLRVVDVQLALQALRPANSGGIRLKIEDDVLPWNDGCFEVAWSEGKVMVAPTDGWDARLDVRALAQVLSGFLSPDTAVRDGRADGEVSPLAAFAGGRGTHCVEYF